nr:MAG TPA: hypothetical protein [Caudoviricetes sp.]
MLRIKVSQNGLTRIYTTNSFKDDGGILSEMHNFVFEMLAVVAGVKKVVSFVDFSTNTNVSVSPVMCGVVAEPVEEE